jgi:hypothetical protein
VKSCELGCRRFEEAKEIHVVAVPADSPFNDGDGLVGSNRHFVQGEPPAGIYTPHTIEVVAYCKSNIEGSINRCFGSRRRTMNTRIGGSFVDEGLDRRWNSGPGIWRNPFRRRKLVVETLRLSSVHDTSRRLEVYRIHFRRNRARKLA